jgi:DNA polymerase V
MAYSNRIYEIYLKYIAPEDIHVYSIDEVFIDATSYLANYHMTARELARTMIQDVLQETGITATAGIGTNLYLAKIALDILAKRSPEFLGILDEERFREALWDHRPLSDFWRISTGTETRLRKYGISTQRQIALCDEDFLYKLFGIDAEILIDHAWGREPTTIADIKNYKSKSKSLFSSQVLMRDYTVTEGELIVKEMADQLCLDMASKHLATDSVTLFVGYSHSPGASGVGGTAKFTRHTNLTSEIVPALAALYRRITDSRCAVRRVGLSCNHILEDTGAFQLNLFEDTARQLRNKALQETLVSIRARYGKNAILKGMNYEQAATTRERNGMIGGHKSGTGTGPHAPLPAGKDILRF